MFSWTIGLTLLTMAILAGFFLLILVMPIVFNNLISDASLLEKLFLKKGAENFYSALIKLNDYLMNNILVYVLAGITMFFLVGLGFVVILQWRYQEHSKKFFYTIFGLSGLIILLLITIIVLTGVWWFSFVALSLAMGVFFIQNAVLKRIGNIDSIDGFDNDDNTDLGNIITQSQLKEQLLANSHLEQLQKNPIKVQQLEPLTKEEIQTDISVENEHQQINSININNLKNTSEIPDILNTNLLKDNNLNKGLDYQKSNQLNHNNEQSGFDSLNSNNASQQNATMMDNNRQMQQPVAKNDVNDSISANNYAQTQQPLFKPQRDTASYAKSLKINEAAFNNVSQQPNLPIDNNHHMQQSMINNHVFNSEPEHAHAPVTANSYMQMQQPIFKSQRDTLSYTELLKTNEGSFNNALQQPFKSQSEAVGYAEIKRSTLEAEVNNRMPNYSQNNLVYGTKRIVEKKDLSSSNGSLLNKVLEKRFEFDSEEEVIDPNKVYYHSPSTGKTIEINHKETQDLLFSDFSEKPQELENPIYEYVPVNDSKKENPKISDKKINVNAHNNYQENGNIGKEIEHYHSQYPNYSFANDNCPICFGN